jgi:hypothetical protein
MKRLFAAREFGKNLHMIFNNIREIRWNAHDYKTIKKYVYAVLRKTFIQHKYITFDGGSLRFNVYNLSNHAFYYDIVFGNNVLVFG